MDKIPHLQERRRRENDEKMLPGISRSWREHRKPFADGAPESEQTSLTRDSAGNSSLSFTAPRDTSSDVLMGNAGIPIPNLSPTKRRATAKKSAGGRPPKRQASGYQQQTGRSMTSVSSLTKRVQRLPSLSDRRPSPELEQPHPLTATPSQRHDEGEQHENSAGHSPIQHAFSETEPERAPSPPASTSNLRIGDDEVGGNPAGQTPERQPSASASTEQQLIGEELQLVQLRQVVRVMNPSWTEGHQSEPTSCDLNDKLTPGQITDAEAWFNHLQVKDNPQFKRWFDKGFSADKMCMAMKVINKNDSNWPKEPAYRACSTCIKRRNPCFLLNFGGAEVLILPQQSGDPFGYWGNLPPPPAPKSSLPSNKKKKGRRR